MISRLHYGSSNSASDQPAINRSPSFCRVDCRCSATGTERADPPRFEHGFEAPQAPVISRLHHGSSERLDRTARINRSGGGGGSHRSGRSPSICGGERWILSLGQRVYPLAGRGIHRPGDRVAMSGNEESDLSRRQSVVLHPQFDRQESDDLIGRAARIVPHVPRYLIFQSPAPSPLLTAHGVNMWPRHMKDRWDCPGAPSGPVRVPFSDLYIQSENAAYLADGCSTANRLITEWSAAAASSSGTVPVSSPSVRCVCSGSCGPVLRACRGLRT